MQVASFLFGKDLEHMGLMFLLKVSPYLIAVFIRWSSKGKK